MTKRGVLASTNCTASSAAVPEESAGGLADYVGIERSETLDATKGIHFPGSLPGGSFPRQTLPSGERDAVDFKNPTLRAYYKAPATSLGNTRNSITPPHDKDAKKKRKRRFRQKYEIAKLLGQKDEMTGKQWRVYHCNHTPVGPPEICRNADGAYFRHVATCGSVWTCPICAAKINAERADEIRRGLAAALGKKYQAFFITYTAQHNRRTTTAAALQNLRGALAYMRSGAAYGRFKKKFGAKGYIRSLEVRFGENGPHVHAHEVLLLDGDLPVVAADIEAAVYGRYGAYLASLGLKVNKHTVTVTEADLGNVEAIGGYLAKSGLEAEIVHGETKTGASVTPFQLVDRYIETGDKRDAAIFCEYARATRGKQQVTWSKGLREDLGVESKPDEEIVEPPEADEEGQSLLLVLTKDQWRRVTAAQLQAPILDQAERGGKRELVRYLYKVGVLKDGDEMTRPPPGRSITPAEEAKMKAEGKKKLERVRQLELIRQGAKYE